MVVGSSPTVGDLNSRNVRACMTATALSARRGTLAGAVEPRSPDYAGQSDEGSQRPATSNQSLVNVAERGFDSVAFG